MALDLEGKAAARRQIHHTTAVLAWPTSTPGPGAVGNARAGAWQFVAAVLRPHPRTCQLSPVRLPASRRHDSRIGPGRAFAAAGAAATKKGGKQPGKANDRSSV